MQPSGLEDQRLGCGEINDAALQWTTDVILRRDTAQLRREQAASGYEIHEETGLYEALRTVWTTQKGNAEELDSAL